MKFEIFYFKKKKKYFKLQKKPVYLFSLVVVVVKERVRIIRENNTLKKILWSTPT